MNHFTQVTLFTDSDGRAKWREHAIPLSEGTPASMLSTLTASGGYQFRESPIGFRSQWHCTVTPQWVIVLTGEMHIGLQDGSVRVFKAGEAFFSDDRLPEGASFDASIHGHWSKQGGVEPLRTLFVRSA